MVTTHALNQLYTCPEVFTERNRGVYLVGPVCSLQLCPRTADHCSSEICHFCEDKLQLSWNKLTGLLTRLRNKVNWVREKNSEFIY